MILYIEWQLWAAKFYSQFAGEYYISYACSYITFFLTSKMNETIFKKKHSTKLQ